jgi:hypothetical protein
VRDLTPTSGPHSLAIAARVWSTCRSAAHASAATPAGEVGVLGRHLERVTAVPECVDHLAEPLGTSADTLAGAGMRSGVGCAMAIAMPPLVTRVSRR